MLRIRTLLTLAAAALVFAAAPAAAQDASARRHGDVYNHQVIDRAVRAFGMDPGRLSRRDQRAIDEAWTELFGHGRRQRLNRAQATAIVYLALVHPYGDTRPVPPPVRDVPSYRDCVEMERDVYRLGNLVAAPERGSGLFVTGPERTEARRLAQRIQETAVECRQTEVADRAGEVMALLSATLPGRDEATRRVQILKEAIQRAAAREPRRR